MHHRGATIRTVNTTAEIMAGAEAVEVEDAPIEAVETLVAMQEKDVLNKQSRY